MTEHGEGLNPADMQRSTEVIPLAEMPQLNGGGFILVPLPEDTILQTRDTIHRRENLPFEFPASEVRRVNEKERKFGERKGWNLLRQSTVPEQPGFAGRVNVHAAQLELGGDQPVFSFVIRPTTFAVASDAEIMKNPQVAEHLSFTGAASYVTTQEEDGSENVVVGYRLEKNANYPGMAGAAAGVPKGQWYPQETRTHDQRGKLIPVDNEFFTQGMLDELHEEIGITSDNIAGGRPKLVAFIKDKGNAGNPHNEFGFEIKFTGTTAELLQLIEQNDDSGRSAFDFKEEAFVIEKSGLRAFLTQSLSPMPESHQGLYAGLVVRDLMEQYKDDPVRLQDELTQFGQELQEERQRVDERVKQFYLDNPDKAAEAREKGYNTEGYDFRVPVVKQGLNDPREWAEQAGIRVA